MEEKKNNDSFYQKLVDGFDVNVLIVGDSIGVGINETSWAGLLASYLQTTYKCKVNLTNVSMGGNSSYAGYARTLMLDDGVDYDLAVICYGQNDREQDFSLYYESIIRALRSKFSKCSVISILESSQRTYTNKMTTIQKICEHYNIPVADTIAAFANSGKEYSELCSDNVHPNDEGKVIYFETVKNIVDKDVYKRQYVYCDGTRLNQVLINLLSNALKFTPEGGRIDVILSQEPSPKGDGYIRTYFRVKDNGIGMEPEFLERVFDSFTREDDKRCLLYTSTLVSFFSGSTTSSS